MEKTVKSFVRRILALHAVLLLLLLAVVFHASRTIYSSARAQALAQAEERQDVLAAQTSRGIDNFYQSILQDLNLLKPAQNPDDAEAAPAPAPPPPPPRPGAGHLAVAARGVIAGQLLVRQLQGRSYVFWVDRTLMRPHTIGSAAGSTPFEDQIVQRMGPWLKAIREPAISRFTLINERGMNLICMPLQERRNGVLVAAVPVKPIETQFLEDLNRRSTSGAFLVDESNLIMAASHPGPAGKPLNASHDPQLSLALSSLPGKGYEGARLITRRFKLGGETLEPAILTIDPIQVLDKQWYVIIASPLSDVDKVLNDLYRDVWFWAAFVVVSTMAILVSTSVLLIRSRLRLARERHEMLSRELNQARQIQLAWLPEPSTRGPGIDIATANQPASHISGDFYNWFHLSDGRTVVTIGDVTGHGMSAAFLMATTQLLVRNTMPVVRDPGRCLEEVNRQLCTQAFNGQFVTMQILLIDSETGRVSIATAGHPAPLIRDGDTFTSLPLEPQLVLGVEKGTVYPTETFDLSIPASLLLYTDGVVDLQSETDERLGLSRLRKALRPEADGAQTLLDDLVSHLAAFRGRRDLGDDLTLVAVQVLAAIPTEPEPAAAFPPAPAAPATAAPATPATA